MREDIITGVLIDPYASTKHGEREDFDTTLSVRLKVLAIENSLQAKYDLLHCRCIDIVTRSIGGKEYSIVLDDEGLLIDKPVMSAVAEKGDIPMLAGALFICKSVYDAKEMGMVLTSIDEDDISNIMGHVKIAVDSRKSINELTSEDCYPVLVLDGNGYC